MLAYLSLENRYAPVRKTRLIPERKLYSPKLFARPCSSLAISLRLNTFQIVVVPLNKFQDEFGEVALGIKLFFVTFIWLQPSNFTLSLLLCYFFVCRRTVSHRRGQKQMHRGTLRYISGFATWEPLNFRSERQFVH